MTKNIKQSRRGEFIRTIGINQWSEILVGLGIDPQFLVRRHGPCPACGGKDRFRFDDLEGRGTFYCNQCGAGDGIRLLQNVFGWTFPETLKAVSGYLIGRQKPNASTGLAIAAKERPSWERLVNRLWSEATSIQKEVRQSPFEERVSVNHGLTFFACFERSVVCQTAPLAFFHQVRFFRSGRKRR